LGGESMEPGNSTTAAEEERDFRKARERSRRLDGRKAFGSIILRLKQGRVLEANEAI